MTATASQPTLHVLLIADSDSQLLDMVQRQASSEDFDPTLIWPN